VARNSAAFRAEGMSNQEPNKALQAIPINGIGTGLGVLGVDMKFDCQICIWTSGSAAVAELGLSA
jgi:hypothetical protein